MHLGAELGARTDADEVGVGDTPFQLVFGKRFLVAFDLRVAGCGEFVDRTLADAFEQQHADVLLRKRRSLHGLVATLQIGKGYGCRPPTTSGLRLRGDDYA